MMSMKIFHKQRSSVTANAAIVVTVLVTLLGSVFGEYESNGVGKFVSRSLDGTGNTLCSGANCGERGDGMTGAMWFGPRLGRRRRSEEKTEGFDDYQINAIADALDGSPWALVPVQHADDKRHTNQFTPRLGRESTEEFIQKYILVGDNSRLARLIDASDDLAERQSPPPPPPPFAPRLGRNLPFTPSPRLGRRLRAILQKLNEQHPL